MAHTARVQAPAPRFTLPCGLRRCCYVVEGCVCCDRAWYLGRALGSGLCQRGSAWCSASTPQPVQISMFAAAASSFASGMRSGCNAHMWSRVGGCIGAGAPVVRSTAQRPKLRHRGLGVRFSCSASLPTTRLQTTLDRLAPAARRARRASTWSVDAAETPFRTTRLPSLQTTYRTVAGIEETTAVLEEVCSQVQQFAPSAESIAAKLSPRTARELARALAADTGDGVVTAPSKRTLVLLGLSSCVPFIGFGYVRHIIVAVAATVVTWCACPMQVRRQRGHDPSRRHGGKVDAAHPAHLNSCCSRAGQHDE